MNRVTHRLVPGLAALLVCGPRAQDDPDPALPFERALTWLDRQAAAFAADLGLVHAGLWRRGDDALRTRLSPTPPRPRPRGHGILPPLLDDLPIAPAPLECRRYSLAALTTDFAADLRDAAILAMRAADADEPPADLLVELEHLRARHGFLESQLAYHRYWQRAVLDHREFFAGRNELLARAERIDSGLRAGTPAESLARERDELAALLAPFRPTGRTVERRGEELVLSIELVTDIGDETFLAAFGEAIDAAWSRSPAARARRFRIELTWRRLPLDDLYPDDPPSRGTSIDEATHLGRFPRGALVLTTGAASTHAELGRAIVLGTDPVRPRELAHEFGHLLGFQDAYLRGYEGRIGDRFGVVLVEWSGLCDDLMGSSVHGVVTDAMLDRLTR
jgi:hypothetical protein